MSAVDQPRPMSWDLVIDLSNTAATAGSFKAMLEYDVPQAGSYMLGAPAKIVLTHPYDWGDSTRETLAGQVQASGVEGVETLTEPRAVEAILGEELPVGQSVTRLSLEGVGLVRMSTEKDVLFKQHVTGTRGQDFSHSWTWIEDRFELMTDPDSGDNQSSAAATGLNSDDLSQLRDRGSLSKVRLVRFVGAMSIRNSGPGLGKPPGRLARLAAKVRGR